MRPSAFGEIGLGRFSPRTSGEKRISADARLPSLAVAPDELYVKINGEIHSRCAQGTIA